MKILVAPDKFKGSLTAFEAAEAMRLGVGRACPEAEVVVCPLSDGGDGFVDVMRTALGGEARRSRVTGPEGEPVDASWALLDRGDGGRTAILEIASVVGMRLVRRGGGPSDRTTYGLGELLLQAVDAGAATVLVGVGGSGTTDCGAGMAQALGVVFDGGGPRVTGARLPEVRGFDLGRRDPRLAGTSIRAVLDVDSPLTGPGGGTHMFGAQKGAGPAERAWLDEAFACFAGRVGDPGNEPGDGAAGGLGYGLRVFAGARPVRGIDLVLGCVDFEAKLEGCDLVLTGEGRLDAQTARGKVVSGVAERCRARGIPAVALAGSVAGARPAELGLTACFSICDGPRAEADALRDAAALLAAAAENVAHLRRAR